MSADGPLVELRTLPCYNEPLKKPQPFLMPAEDDQVIEILPAEKENRKIQFQEEILVTEIEDRFFFYGEEMEEEEEEAYEIEIVEDDGDADFYLEIVDGEVFYVFETEDDISEDSMDELLDGDEASVASSFESSMHSGTSDLGFDLTDLKAPNLDAGGGDDGDAAEPKAGGDAPMIQEVPFPEEIKLNQLNDEIDSASDANPNDFMLEFEDDSDDGAAAATKLDISEDAKDDIERHTAQKEERQKAKAEEPPEESSSSSSSSSSATSPARRKQALKHKPAEPASPEGSEGSMDLLGGGGGSPTKVPGPPPSPPPSPGGNASVSVAGSQGPLSPNSRARSILKANAPSPRAETKKIKSKKDDSDKKSKKPSFTKTYVRAEQFDGEHRVYSWQKPDWAEGEQLAPTPEGEAARKGGNLAGPITPDAKATEESGGLVAPGSPTKGGEVDKEEILRRFVSGEIGSGLMTNSLYGRHHRKLKLSVNGAKLREGGDIVKPITKATVIRTPNDINHVANPGVLKATPKVDKKTYKWEKPSWAQGAKLKSTSAGAAIKGGGDLQAPITQRVIADAEAATAANRKLRGGKVVVVGAEGGGTTSWNKPSWASRGAESGNGLRKASSHSEHSKGSNSSGELGNMRQMLRKTPSSTTNSAVGESASSSARPDDNTPLDDPEAERKRRHELLARVAKSWG